MLGFEPGKAELEKTTPHHCVMEEGIFSAALLALVIDTSGGRRLGCAAPE